MDNQLDTRLGALKLPVSLKPEYDRNTKLIDLIEKPLWTATGKTANDTLIPDLIYISVKCPDSAQFMHFSAQNTAL